MTSVIVIAVGLARVGIANADDGPAPAHAQRSTTVYLSSVWSPGPTVPIRIGADGVVRTHRRGFALEARLGLGGAASVNGLGGQFAVHGGLAIGGALALGPRVVLAPMIAYDAFAEWEWYGAKVTVDYVTFGYHLDRPRSRRDRAVRADRLRASWTLTTPCSSSGRARIVPEARYESSEVAMVTMPVQLPAS
jgi:hypothetical protein